ncbi:MAG: hypothetical protein JXR03_08725 [Cyclobacteriaceae bacterium]
MKALLKYFIPILLIFSLCHTSSGQGHKPRKKINGTSLVNPPSPVKIETIESVTRINSDWVAIIPYAFCRQNEPGVYFNNNRQWWGEKVEGTKELIKMSQKCKLNVMVKPHIWMGGGFIGNYDLNSEEKWLEWEESYEKYIMTFAKVSQSLDVPLLCIGTELKKAVKREKYWRSLIDKVRDVYCGQITYASNWDNYNEVKFWDALDYIGVDAYFPLVDGKTPEASEIESAWGATKLDLKAVSKRYDVPVLFTEYGYQSVDGAAGKHWEVNTSSSYLNMEVQSRSYECLFRSFWNEEWFAGGFLWKWHLKENAGGEGDPNFTPQGKPVEAVIKKWYGTVPKG